MSDLDGVREIHTNLLAYDNAQKIIATERLIRSLSPVFQLGRDSNVIDIGVGRGRFVVMLRALSDCRISGIDDFADATYNYESIDRAMRPFGIEMTKGDIMEPFPFDDQTFDLAVCFNTFEHLPASPRKVMREIYRILKPGGMCVIGMPNILALYKRIRVLSGRTNLPRFDVWWTQHPWRGHIREAAPDELREILIRSGFRAGQEIGIDCELPNRMLRPAYLVYGAIVALAPRRLADVLFCAGIKS